MTAFSRGRDGRGGLSGVASGGGEMLSEGETRYPYETSPFATLNAEDPDAMGRAGQQHEATAGAAGGDASQLSTFQSDQVPSFLQQASASAEGRRESARTEISVFPTVSLSLA